MASKKSTIKNYDIVRSKFNKTKDIVKLCDKFRDYKETINSVCEAIVNMDRNTAINKISINVEIKLPKEKRDKYSLSADSLLRSLADADNPDDFMDKLKKVDKYVNIGGKNQDRQVKLSHFNVDLKGLTDNSLISILMRMRETIDKELKDCSDKFNEIFK